MTQPLANIQLEEAENRLRAQNIITPMCDGWLNACLNSVDGERVRILNQIYAYHEPPNLDDEETALAIPQQLPRGFTAKLLWVNTTAVGFALILEQGMMTSDGPMNFNTVDGIFIRRSHRKQGWATKLIEDLILQYSNQDLAFSMPLSYSLWQVLSRFLKNHVNLRDKLWVINGTGAEGDRFNVTLELIRRKLK